MSERHVTRTALVLVLLGTDLGAQAASPPTLEGRVIREDSVPVVGATVRIMQGATVHVVRSDDLGRYRITAMTDGSWTVAVQAVGHVAHFERLTYAGPAMRRDFILKRVQTELDPVLVEGDWSGVRGFVADDRDLAVLSGARITVLSKGSDEVLTDTSGHFSIEKPRGSRVMMRVQRPGYADRIVLAEASGLRSARLIVRLDTLWEPRRDWMQREEQRLRLQWAGGKSAQVGREELAAIGSRDLKMALWASPTMTARGISLLSSACLFLDGVAKPGLPYYMIDPQTVEFVEVYAEDSDYSNTLASRWPPKGECGVPEQNVGPPRRGLLGSYIVIWTRPQKPVTK